MVATEFGIAATLLVAPRAGAEAAMSVLTGFSAVALVRLARGRLSSGPLGWPALARNGCFTTLAAIVELDGQFAWPSITFAITMLITWLASGLDRRRRARAGAATGLDLDKLLKARRPVVLVFSQPGCGACAGRSPHAGPTRSETSSRKRCRSPKKTGESRTFDGGCNTATCTATIWSAATPDLPATAQYRKGMKQLGQQMVDFRLSRAAPVVR